MWTSQQKSLLAIIEQKLRVLDGHASRHRGIRSGEIPQVNPDRAAQAERLNMLLCAQALAFDLGCLIKLEIEPCPCPIKLEVEA